MATFASYCLRDTILSRMGFSNYAEYLSSSLWRAIRNRAMKKAGKKCSVCGEPATEVHHRDYSEATLRGTDAGSLTCLCAVCHDLAEFDGDRKTDHDGANSRITLFAGNSKPAPPPLPPKEEWADKKHVWIIAEEYYLPMEKAWSMPKKQRRRLMGRLAKRLNKLYASPPTNK